METVGGEGGIDRKGPGPNITEKQQTEFGALNCPDFRGWERTEPVDPLGRYVTAGSLIIYQLKVSYLIRRGEDRLLKFKVSEK
ncbi:hypothetical protein ACOSQ3_013832 [Xanthoceras sorbifolium]